MAARNKTQFNEVYLKFLEHYKNTVKEQTFNSFVLNFNSHIIPYFNNKCLNSLKKKDFYNWKDYILKKGFKNSFNKKLYSELNTFLNYCLDTDLIKVNYLQELGNFKNKVEIKKEDFYTLKEFKTFSKGFSKSDIVYKQFFNLLFYGGLRPSEAMALTFNDLNGNRLSINKNIQRKGKRKIETPKNQSSFRTIIIDRKTLKGILKLKKLYKYYSDDYFIFGGSRPLSPTTIDRKKRSACEKMHIREITQHQFRHSHATLLIENGIPVNEVSKRLGHSNTSTTLDIYTHCSFEQEKKVLKVLNFLHF